MEENCQIPRPFLQAEQDAATKKELGVEHEEENSAFKHQEIQVRQPWIPDGVIAPEILLRRGIYDEGDG